MLFVRTYEYQVEHTNSGSNNLMITSFIQIVVLSRNSRSNPINQFLWQTCQIIGFQVSLLHSEKNVIFEKCQAYKSKIYPTHIAHMQIS